MSSFNEFQSLVFIHFKWLGPLSGQALVTDRPWAIADNFTRFGNITLITLLWLATTQLEYSLAVAILCNELEVFSLRLKGYNLYLICGTNVVCKCGLVHPVALEISGFLCRETLQ